MRDGKGGFSRKWRTAARVALWLTLAQFTVGLVYARRQVNGETGLERMGNQVVRTAEHVADLSGRVAAIESLHLEKQLADLNGSIALLNGTLAETNRQRTENTRLLYTLATTAVGQLIAFLFSMRDRRARAGASNGHKGGGRFQ